MYIENVGGDIYALIFHAIFWTVCFITFESISSRYWDSLCIKRTHIKPMTTDEQVLEEERKVRKLIENNI